ELLVLPLVLLDLAHGDLGGGPVDHDRISERVHGGEAPTVRVRPESGELAAEGHDLGEGRGAVGVGDVAALRRVHDVAAAPEVVEGVVDRDGAAAVLIGEANAGLDRLAGDGLAELAVRVPALHGGETGLAHL